MCPRVHRDYCKVRNPQSSSGGGGAERTLTGSDTARTTVHVRDVQDRWAPYETMLEVSTADELSDTALAAAFPLHTASPALSSNHISLNEITEDNDEDEGVDKPKPLTHTPSISSVSSRKRATEKRPPSQRSYRSPPPLTSAHFAGDHSSPVLKHKSSLSQFLVREELGHKSVTPLNEHPTSEDTASARDDAASITSARTEPAASSAPPSVRLHANESADYDLEKYLDSFFKPKIKLGPRPVNVSDKARRTTASAPVSSLPAGIQSRAKQALSQPQPQYSAVRNTLADPSAAVVTAPPRLPSLHFSPQIPDIPDFLPPRPSSRGSSRSLPAPRSSKAFLSPEKQRLMKALEIRKKQMRHSTSQEQMSTIKLHDATPSVAVKSSQPQLHQVQPQVGATKADSCIDMANSPIAEEVPTSQVLQNVEPSLAEGSLGPSNTDLQPLISQQKQADTPSTESSTNTVVPGNKGETFVDSQDLDTTAPEPNISDTTTSNEQPADPEMTEPSTHNQVPIIAHGPIAEVQKSLPEEQSASTISDLQNHTVPGNSTSAPTAEQQAASAAPDTQTQDLAGGSVVNPVSEDPEDRDTLGPEIEKGSDELHKKRRRGLVEPLQIDVRLERHASEHKFLSDDEFMDELQTATFEQATPIAMSKSPASPFFPPRRPSSRSAKSSNSVAAADDIPLIPTISNTLEKHTDFLLPSYESQNGMPTRTPSVSSVRTPDSERGDPVPLIRKSNVSSGISARIAALAESSSREGSPPVAPGSRKLSAKSTLAQRKSSFIDHTAENQAIPGAERRHVGKLSIWPSNPSSQKTRNGQPENRESVSVTARIVRVPRASEAITPPELQASPLLFNHTRPGHADNSNPIAPIVTNGLPTKAPHGEHDSVMSPQSRDGVASRGSIESSATTGRRKSFDRKSFKGFGGPPSPKKNALKHSATMPPLEPGSPDKSSRTSRFLKRISHLGKDKRKSAPQVPTITTTPSEPTPSVPVIPSAPVAPAVTAAIPDPIPTLAPAPAPAPAPTPVVAPATLAPKPRPDSSADVPPPTSIGDLNVQFPETPLWKRRWVEIDSFGNIMFTAAARHSNVNKSFNSQFHMKELSAPFIPDIDCQEMPHSVLFDLTNGEGSLQFASEDAMSQRQLLSCKCCQWFPCKSSKY